MDKISIFCGSLSNYIKFKFINLPNIEDVISKKVNRNNITELKPLNLHIFPIRASKNVSYPPFVQVYPTREIEFNINLVLALDNHLACCWMELFWIIEDDDVENQVERIHAIYLVSNNIKKKMKEKLVKISLMLKTCKDEEIKKIQTSKEEIEDLRDELEKIKEFY